MEKHTGEKARFHARDIALGIVLVAIAMVLVLIEQWIPIAFSIPGIRIGLANIVTVFALYVMGVVPALCILALRCILAAAIFGTFTSFVISIAGGLLALLAMWLLSGSSLISPLGVSVGGAAAHAVGQILAAMVMLGSMAPLTYLSALLLAAIVTGAITGVISCLLLLAYKGGARLVMKGDVSGAEEEYAPMGAIPQKETIETLEPVEHMYELPVVEVVREEHAQRFDRTKEPERRQYEYTHRPPDPPMEYPYDYAYKHSNDFADVKDAGEQNERERDEGVGQVAYDDIMAIFKDASLNTVNGEDGSDSRDFSGTADDEAPAGEPEMEIISIGEVIDVMDDDNNTQEDATTYEME